MSILNNLKVGLISDIEIDSKKSKARKTHYQPKKNSIIKEEESGTFDTSGKYINPLAYKQRLRNNKA